MESTRDVEKVQRTHDSRILPFRSFKAGQFGCARRLGAAGVLQARATERRERPARLLYGKAHSLHSSGAGRIAACGSRPAQSRRRPGQPVRGGPEPLTQTVWPTGAPPRACPGATGPRGQAAHSVGSGQLRRSAPARPCLPSATLSPFARPRGTGSAVRLRQLC